MMSVISISGSSRAVDYDDDDGSWMMVAESWKTRRRKTRRRNKGIT
jgi:hypothetical protein